VTTFFFFRLQTLQRLSFSRQTVVRLAILQELCLSLTYTVPRLLVVEHVFAPCSSRPSQSNSDSHRLSSTATIAPSSSTVTQSPPVSSAKQPGSFSPDSSTRSSLSAPDESPRLSHPGQDEESLGLVSALRDVDVGHPRHTFDFIIPQPRLRPPGIGSKVLAFVISRGKQRKGDMAGLTGKPLLYCSFRTKLTVGTLRVCL
jgi:hypothetical protein